MSGSGEKTSSEIAQEYQAFLDSGGQVEELPAERVNPRKFQTVSMLKPEKSGKKISSYEAEKIPRGEMLSSKLNLGSQDFSNIGRSSKPDRTTPGQIHAALAQAGIRDHQEKFMLFVWTEDEQYRSAARALLLSSLVDMALSEEWKIKKTGIMNEMSFVALENFLNPAKYQNRSARAWARDCGIACHKDWQRPWAGRYQQLMAFGDRLLERGQLILARGI